MKNATAGVLLCLVVALCFSSCRSSDPAATQDPSISGAWGLQSVDDESGTRVYTRLEALTGDRDGYCFGPAGLLLIRDAGWCGTPPLSFSNHEGSWTRESEFVLVLSDQGWDAIRSCRLTILSLGEAELRCTVVAEE